MSIQVVDTDFVKTISYPVMFDGVVTAAFTSMETFTANDNSPDPSVILTDSIIVNPNYTIAKVYPHTSWIVLFYVGCDAAAIPIGVVVISDVDDINSVKENLEKLFNYKEVIIKTERTIYSDVECSNAVGEQVSYNKVQSSLLDIRILRIGDFQGIWVDC